MKQFTTEQINQAVNGTLNGSPTIMITGVEQISEAATSQLTFIGEKKYIKLWDQSRASAAIVNDSLDVKPGPGRAFIRVADADITSLLIEDLELERLEAAASDGRKIEYSLFLEAVSTDRTEYWVFVVLPYEGAQAWFDAKRAYHGRKAEEYYGKTRSELERALSQGLNINAELRFWIKNGETSLQVPEDVILSRYKFQPVFDLGTGRRPDPAAKTE